ncbi:hypothetical protein C8Q74DRAFT_991876 [Fomes fomentarius]|nr:hypothetical protein C8Q74DRAFT_991876 [Fomes fomentarius]
MNRFTFHIKCKVARRVVGLLVQYRKVHNAREDSDQWEAGGRVGTPETSSGSRTFQHPIHAQPYSSPTQALAPKPRSNTARGVHASNLMDFSSARPCEGLRDLWGLPQTAVLAPWSTVLQLPDTPRYWP